MPRVIKVDWLGRGVKILPFATEEAAKSCLTELYHALNVAYDRREGLEMACDQMWSVESISTDGNVSKVRIVDEHSQPLLSYILTN